MLMQTHCKYIQMGHRFSKTATNNIVATKTTTTTRTETTTYNTTKTPSNKFRQLQAFTTTTTSATNTTNIIPIPNSKQQFLGPTINLQIQESPNITYSSTTSINNTTALGILQSPQYTTNSISSSLTSINNLTCGRQIIIKIQLAKMENGNEISSTTITSSSSSAGALIQQQVKDTSIENLISDCNLNSNEISTEVMGTQFLNLALDSNNCNLMPTPSTIKTGTTSLSPSSASSLTSALCRTAGSSLSKNNNYLNSNSSGSSNASISSSSPITIPRNEWPERLNSLQFNDEIVEQNIGEIVEYCEVLEQPCSTINMQMSTITEERDNEANACCRRKSKSLAANGGSSMASSSNTGIKTKSRCRKCSCRDAFRRFLDPSLSRSSNKAGKQQHQKDQERIKSEDRHSTNNPLINDNTNTQQQPQCLRNSMHSTTANTITVDMAANTATPNTTASTIVMSPVVTNQLPLWPPAPTTNSNDVIIPLTTPTPSQFVVVQCAIVNPSNVAMHSLTTTNTSSTSSLSTNSLISIVHDISATTSPPSNEEVVIKVPSNASGNVVGSTGGPTVHSQVDFVHYLVPDMERISNSSFYWGKIDRYEAERLLEGKPEGTFLLRDSAQEEFLFSVTFRKFGRSLHARIEQSGHRFSFDCHDPCVFTAPTVIGLLEHYKDPTCVMFFEPMLTIPLHRKNCFSLQKLCRATIVSNTTYDGINELELPARLKSYLKEYHYKQKLRVKSNEPTYNTIHCK